jgi:trehalose 6-phosphate synthase/trehalose 6-phosphate phosphatase
LTGETKKKLEEFFAAFTRASKPLLMVDYDGTLAPFRVDRFQARPWAGVRELLARIQGQSKTRIVVITGRPAAEIPALLGVEPAPEIWGLHGAERLHANGRRELKQAPPKTRAKLNELQSQLRHDALGGLFEEKANAAVMHWRGVPAKKAREIEKRTRELFEPLAKFYGLSLLQFEAGLELRAGPEKGDAARALIGEVSNGEPQPSAYLGDDLTDEAAFHAIKSHGLSVLVRRQRRESAAEVWLRPPDELRVFLKWWLQACHTLAPQTVKPFAGHRRPAPHR